MKINLLLYFNLPRAIKRD